MCLEITKQKFSILTALSAAEAPLPLFAMLQAAEGVSLDVFGSEKHLYSGKHLEGVLDLLTDAGAIELTVKGFRITARGRQGIASLERYVYPQAA